ncbi:MAG: hypothetical protein QNJ78_16555 [Gammaproteobacteria bacterium]|nr:hypothetical protein [Gammaproteobacteria bacterium]
MAVYSNNIHSDHAFAMQRLNYYNTTHWPIVIIGLSALLMGIAVYLLDRPSAQTYFIPEWISLFEETPRLFGLIGNHLPTFLHVFGFSLISCGLLTQSRFSPLGICLFWIALDGLFEIGQHPLISACIVQYIPAWFNQVIILENTQAYFLSGSFDPMDLVSILFGGILAYLLVRVFVVKHASV